MSRIDIRRDFEQFLESLTNMAHTIWGPISYNQYDMEYKLILKLSLLSVLIPISAAIKANFRVFTSVLHLGSLGVFKAVNTFQNLLTA